MPQVVTRLNHAALATMSEEALAAEFVHWFRVYRNEGRLIECERAYFKAIVSEQEKRKLETRTPLMKNWRELKNTLPANTVLLFRLGDFYEAFYEDAATLAYVCNIALTKRNLVPMSGIPSHGQYLYVPKLVAAGYRVALANPDDLTPALSPNFKVPPTYQPRKVTETFAPATNHRLRE
jgi:MutS domain I